MTPVRSGDGTGSRSPTGRWGLATSLPPSINARPAPPHGLQKRSLPFAEDDKVEGGGGQHPFRVGGGLGPAGEEGQPGTLAPEDGGYGDGGCAVPEIEGEADGIGGVGSDDGCGLGGVLGGGEGAELRGG